MHLDHWPSASCNPYTPLPNTHTHTPHTPHTPHTHHQRSSESSSPAILARWAAQTMSAGWRMQSRRRRWSSSICRQSLSTWSPRSPTLPERLWNICSRAWHMWVVRRGNSQGQRSAADTSSIDYFQDLEFDQWTSEQEGHILHLGSCIASSSCCLSSRIVATRSCDVTVAYFSLPLQLGITLLTPEGLLEGAKCIVSHNKELRRELKELEKEIELIKGQNSIMVSYVVCQ